MRKSYQQGISLVELMIAITIGLILMVGLTLSVTSSMSTRAEMDKANRQIENGRYALETIGDDVRHAGLYGVYRPPVLTSPVPDPCSTNFSNIAAALSWQIQGYHNYDPASGAISCLPVGVVLAGSDVLVVRRMSTAGLLMNTHSSGPAATAPCAPTAASASIDPNTIYIQPGLTGDVNNSPDVRVTTGNNIASLNLKQKVPCSGTASTPDAYTDTADIYPMVVRIYFVSPCSYGSGTAGACTANDDGIPTLKRIELGSGPTFGSPMAIAEGIEKLHIEYGVDGDGDGTIDGALRQCLNATDCTATDWQNVVGLSVYLLARNTEATNGYVDAKTYQMGALSVPVTNDAYKRHVFNGFIRVRNLSMGRECTPTTANPTCP